MRGRFDRAAADIFAYRFPNIYIYIYSREPKTFRAPYRSVPSPLPRDTGPGRFVTIVGHERGFRVPVGHRRVRVHLCTRVVQEALGHASARTSVIILRGRREG